MVAKIVDPETGEGPLIGSDGLLLVKGPIACRATSVSRSAPRDVLRDGWYVTGDIASIDEAGFIRITDRLSRFSKIAGEMVPHMKVEEQIQALLEEQHTCVVTAIPDESAASGSSRSTPTPASPADPVRAPLPTELPRLWLPKREDLRLVEAIPSLGTGKVDLRAVRLLAAGVVEAVTS